MESNSTRPITVCCEGCTHSSSSMRKSAKRRNKWSELLRDGFIVWCKDKDVTEEADGWSPVINRKRKSRTFLWDQARLTLHCMSPSSLRLHKAVIIVLWDCKTSRSATVDDAVLKHLQRILLNSLKTWRFTRIMKLRVFTLVTLERVWTLLTGWTCSEQSGWSLSLRWTRPELSLMRLCRFLQVSANYWHFMTHFCRKVQHTARLET